jgi:hypothetical protein
MDDPFGVLTNIDYQELLNTFKSKCQINTIGEERDIDICTFCGNVLERDINNIKSTCKRCGIISDEVEDVINTSEINSNKLRIVGYNSNHFQPDLYRSDTGNLNMLQYKQILNEYKDYRSRFIEMKGRAFPINACIIATDFYNKIQRQCVKRSQNKKAIMAACLWQACLLVNFAPSKAEVSKFMQLPHKGIARGNNFIISLVSDNKLELDTNKNPLYPEIITLFVQLGYTDKKYEVLHKHVENIIDIANKNFIGMNSLPRSKVIGTTYIVLKRCQDTSLVPEPPIDTKTFCKNKIRKNTIDKFIKELTDYHSYFIDYYKQAGLLFHII